MRAVCGLLCDCCPSSRTHVPPVTKSMPDVALGYRVFTACYAFGVTIFRRGGTNRCSQAPAPRSRRGRDRSHFPDANSTDRPEKLQSHDESAQSCFVAVDVSQTYDH